jgi:hypothetical protein
VKGGWGGATCLARQGWAAPFSKIHVQPTMSLLLLLYRKPGVSRSAA